VWEDALRGRDREFGFIARWVHAVMFYELPTWIFTTAYVAFAVAVAATWWLIPPVRTAKRSRAAPQVRTRTR
jgi:hypothetical protein